MTGQQAAISGYLSGFRSQYRIVMALFFREVRTRFGAQRLGIFWGVVEPMIHVAGFCLLALVFGRIGPYSIPYVPFLMSGIFPFVLMRNSFRRVVRSVEANRPLLVFPQIKSLDLALARVLVEFMNTSLAMIVALSLYSWFVEPIQIGSWTQAIVAYGVFALFGLALGLFFQPLMSVPNFDMFSPLFMRVLYLSSGIFFSLEHVPDPYRQYLAWNPLAQLLDIFRDGFFARYWSQPGFDNWGYITLVTAGLFVCAHLIERRISVMTGGELND